MNVVNVAVNNRPFEGEPEPEQDFWEGKPIPPGGPDNQDEGQPSEEPRVGSIAQRILLGTTVVCGVLSLIPPLRLGVAIAMRGISLLSVSLRKTPEGREGPLIQAVKVAAVVVGIVGLAAATPMMIVGSIAADMGLQIIQGARAIHRGDLIAGRQIFLHLLILVIDTLTLAGIIAGSWELLVAAATVSAAAMILFAFLTFLNQDGHLIGDGPIGNGYAAFDFFSFMALAGIGLAAAFSIAEYDGLKRRYQATIKNDNPNEKIVVMDNLTRQIVSEAPTGQDLAINFNSGNNYQVLHIPTNVTNGFPTYSARLFTLPHQELPNIARQALSADQLPTVPVGGIAMKAIEPPFDELN